MSKNLLNRYVWLVDTIRRHGTISRDRLNRLWMQSPFSDGTPLPRRTFYNYRNAIEELFKINIECNPATFEYYIDSSGSDANRESLSDWILNSAAMSDVLSNMDVVADRIFLEDVPSARLYLSPVTSALRDFHPVTFAYHPYTRVNPTPGVVLEPYFLKIFRQRWYVTGRNVREDTIKTYALDRMSDLTVDESTTYRIPDDFDSRAFVSDAFGVVFSHGETREVRLRTDSRQAKYLRALPLHHSQREEAGGEYPVFTYRLRLTPDFVQEILSMGPSVTVIAPTELRAMVVESLRQSLANYGQK